jgi:hypothetical protein
MFGLLNLTPEQRDMLLGMGAGLLGGGRNTGEAISRGLLMGANQRNEGMVLRDRQKTNEQDRQRQQMHMDQFQKAQADQQGMRGAFQTAFMQPNQNLVQNDDMGNAMPQAPGGGGMPEFLKMAGQYMDPMQAAQMMAPKPRAPMILGKGARAFDESGREVAANPEAEESKIREVKTGNKVITYEIRGGEWKKIGEAPLFKPDSPDKPDKPPAGYRLTPEGNLAFIPGGPADPNTGRKNATPTEDERRSAGLAIRMEGAIAAMQKFPQAGRPEVPAEILRGMPLMPEAAANAATSKERQQVESAQLDALDAALTLATGAAYTKDQLKNLSKSYFPQLMDDPETVAAKEERLKKVIQTARIRAGRAEGDIAKAGGASGGWSIKPIK